MLFKSSVLAHTNMPVLSKALDAYALRSKAIGNNIANATSPEYQRIEVGFEEQLREALDEGRVVGKRTDANHMRLGRPKIDGVEPSAYRAKDKTNPGEINNVDIDLEMGKLAENQMMFNFAVKAVRNQMDGITAAIRGERQSA